MDMSLTQQQIDTFCNIKSNSLSNTNFSVTSPDRSKASNDTGCETDFKNLTNEQCHNNSGSTTTSIKSYSGRNLIVNYLPQNMTEMDIHKLFSMYGDVESCKLIRNKDLKQSLGYAFVKYHNSESANKAIEELNGLSIENKKIKVSVARPSRPEIKDANLYVGGLPANCTEEQLKKLFQDYGEIISCRVIKPLQKTADYHFGFVRFDTNHEAHRAMQSIHGKIPPKNVFPDATGPITVKFARTPNPPDYMDYRLTQTPYILSESLACQNNISSRLSNNYNNTPSSMASIYNQQRFLNPVQSNPSLFHSAENINPSCGHLESDECSKPFCSAKVGRGHMNYCTSINYNHCSNEYNHKYNSHLPSLNTLNQDNPLNSTFNNNLLILINLPFDYTELSVYKLCTKFGPIKDVKVFLEDQVCFSTVEMKNKVDMLDAASHLNGLILSQYKPISAIIL